MKCCLDQFLVLGIHINYSVLDIGSSSVSLSFLLTFHAFNPIIGGGWGRGWVLGYSGLSHLPGHP